MLLFIYYVPRYLTLNLVQICKPNAGVPIIGGDGIPCYPQSPEEFASIVMDCRKNGANVLGGCCGTAPEFIEAVKNALK